MPSGIFDRQQPFNTRIGQPPLSGQILPDRTSFGLLDESAFPIV